MEPLFIIGMNQPFNGPIYGVLRPDYFKPDTGSKIIFTLDYIPKARLIFKGTLEEVKAWVNEYNNFHERKIEKKLYFLESLEIS